MPPKGGAASWCSRHANATCFIDHAPDVMAVDTVDRAIAPTLDQTTFDRFRFIIVAIAQGRAASRSHPGVVFFLLCMPIDEPTCCRSKSVGAAVTSSGAGIFPCAF